MCVGKKSSGGGGSTAAAPKPRIDPVSPAASADAWRDPFGSLSKIAGVHTSARGDTSAANRGEVQVNGLGSALLAGFRDPKNPGPVVDPERPRPPAPADPTTPVTPPRGGNNGGRGGNGAPREPFFIRHLMDNANTNNPFWGRMEELRRQRYPKVGS